MENTAKEISAGIVQVAKSGLVCDYCHEPPHLTETKDDHWACDSCYMKWWATHCPDCGIAVPENWTPEQRQAHLDAHDAEILNKARAEGTAT
jgi:hypothetical protein